MTYVTDQTSAELRVHMRRLKRMQGWHEPLADRLFKEVVEQDATIKKLEGALAAAEARNATLTDDAARAERNRDMWKDQCAVEAATLATVTPLVQQLVDALEWSTADDFEVPYKCEEAITAARAFLSGATKTGSLTEINGINNLGGATKESTDA